MVFGVAGVLLVYLLALALALGLVAVLRSLPGPSARRVGLGMGAAAVIVGAAYAPVWLYLSVPVGWLRFLPLIPSF